MRYFLLSILTLTGGIVFVRKIKVPSVEQKHIKTLQQDQEVIAETIDYTLQDVESVAEIVVLNADDLAVTAETVDLLLGFVIEQQERIEALENHINGGNV